MFNYFGENVIDYGFSTIVAGLIGYLPISFLNYLKKVELVNLKDKYTILLLIFSANLALISFINNWYLLVVPLTLFFIVSFVLAKKDIKRMLTLFFILSDEKKIGVLYISLIAFMLCFFLSLSLFPASIKNTEGFTNIFAHYIGYIFGFAIPDLFSNKI